MRYFWGSLVLATMAGGAAAASSFVMPERMKAGVGPSTLVAVDAKEAGRASSSSVVAPGERRPGARLHAVIPDPSIIALGAPAPGVAVEKVSAITDKKKEGAPALPVMVIRGGLPGDAFGEPLPAGQAEAQR